MSRSSARAHGVRASDTWFPCVVLEQHDCAVCGQAMPFEVPACGDGHEDECPDRVCTGCGAVLVVGPIPIEGRRTA